MKNKKILIYIALVIMGVLLGWLLFHNSSTNGEVNINGIAEENQMWTCSMHPQIMQPEPGDCPLCGMDLIPAETGADGLTANQFKLTENAMALANIQTTIIGNGEVENGFLTLSGKIAENEEANKVQVSYVAGRIERLYINSTGERIGRGQLLATIYSPELYAAQQELLTAASLKETQPNLYNAVRNKLKLWKLSDKQIKQIETSGKVIERFPVYATVAGTVTEKLVVQGDYIKQGQPLLKVANLNTVWAVFDVYENQISNIKEGQEIIVTTNTYPNKEFKGKVDFIDPVLNTQTRTVNTRVVLNNKEQLFKPGMFVSAKVKGTFSQSKEVLTIPASSILWTGERSVVYLKTNSNEPVFEMKEVVLGNKIGDQYEVVEGLYAGNEIVTNGTFTVDAAAQLQGKKSMMNQANSNSTEHNEHTGVASKNSNADKLVFKTRINVSKKFQQQLSVVVSQYIEVKDALVNDNANNAKKRAKELLLKLNLVDSKLLQGEANENWILLVKDIKSAATSISNNSDIKVQRKNFQILSNAVINAVQLYGINQKVYVEYCPMVENNTGAYWLSEEEKILNPYFGDAMLKCGEVKQIID